MWSNNTGDATIEGGDLIEVFKILTSHESIDPTIFYSILRQVK